MLDGERTSHGLPETFVHMMRLSACRGSHGGYTHTNITGMPLSSSPWGPWHARFYGRNLDIRHSILLHPVPFSVLYPSSAAAACCLPFPKLQSHDATVRNPGSQNTLSEKWRGQVWRIRHQTRSRPIRSASETRGLRERLEFSAELLTRLLVATWVPESMVTTGLPGSVT